MIKIDTKLWTLFLLPVALYGDIKLSSLIDRAHNHREIAIEQSKLHQIKLERKSLSKSYLPRIDASGSAVYTDKTGGFDAKESYNATLSAELMLFDGFKRENRLSQMDSLSASQSHALSSAKKELSLEIIRLAIEYENSIDEKYALDALQEHLEAQHERLLRFKDAGLASEDMLLRIVSELKDVEYQQLQLRYLIEKQRLNIALVSGVSLHHHESIEIDIIEPKIYKKDDSDRLKSLQELKKAKLYESKSASGGLYPTIKLVDELSFNDYRGDSMADMRVRRQNKVLAVASMNLFDFGSESATAEAKRVEALTLEYQIAHQDELDRIEFDLSMDKKAMAFRQLEASISAQEAAQSTYISVKKKYESGIVDFITYLDALYLMHNANNRLSSSKRELLASYAAYYYHSGADPREFVK